MSDDAFARGIATAVRVCMGVAPRDRVYVLTDRETARIGQALGEESAALGAVARVAALEDYAERPLTTFPARLREDVAGFRPTVTFYAATGQPGEIAFRFPFRLFLLEELRVRHGHMVDIDERLVREGLTADYAAVAALTEAVAARARQARTARVTSPLGTDLRVTFDPALRWHASTGLYHEPGTWGNLPEGELYTSPARVDGTLVGLVVGDHFSRQYGVLASPLYVEIEDSRARGVRCAVPRLADELWAYLHSTENGDRVGEFAIGTNTAIAGLTGNLLQDEKIPGVHLAFGNPYPEDTGATWTAAVHVDIVSPSGDVTLDATPLLRDGRFVLGS
ncbi:MAG: aminopeptidase [Chloroflexota bacterium]